METNRLPILYSFRRCPYAMRARLAIASSEQVCELREVVLRNKPQAMLKASPKGTVPVLQLPDGTVVDESLDIMLWALERHDPQRWLTPPTGTPAQMMALISHNDNDFKGHLDRYKYPQRFELISGIDNRDAGAQWLYALDDRLQSHPYLFGDRPCLADMAIAPFVRQYAHTDRDWFWGQNWPALIGWLDNFLNSALFAAIMHKYAPWNPDPALPRVRFPEGTVSAASA